MMFDLFQSKIIAHLSSASGGLAPLQMAKLQHWRGSQAIFGLGGAPVLGIFYKDRHLLPFVLSLSKHNEGV